KLGPSAFDGFGEFLQAPNGTSADLLLATDVRNIEGLFTHNELAAFLAIFLNPATPLLATTDWKSVITGGIKDRVQSCVTACVALGSDPSDISSLAVVDDGLRALRGYTAVHRTAPA